jgi:hypothetical protein
MRVLGAILALGGLALAAYYFWLYDTSPNSIGGSFGEASIELSIEDPGRQEDRKLGIALGLGAAVVGTLMFGLAKGGK